MKGSRSRSRETSEEAIMVIQLGYDDGSDRGWVTVKLVKNIRFLLYFKVSVNRIF